jgi:hypothetical protein
MTEGQVQSSQLENLVQIIKYGGNLIQIKDFERQQHRQSQ